MDVERYLGEVFDGLTSAPSQDACVQIAARAAGELGGAYGTCLLSATGADSTVALVAQSQLYLCDMQSSGMYRTAAALRRSAHTDSRTLWGREDFATSPNGERRRLGMTLIVPMKAPSHLAVGFLWQPGEDQQRTRTLVLLAKALDLAASGWRKYEDNALRQRNTASVHHRLRNNLALVRSIVRRSHETAESAEHFALHLEARIGALTRIQGAVVAAGEAGVDLEELFRTELIASAVGEHSYVVHGPAVRMHDKSAELLALVAHELATNSLKFGALGTPSARLVVSWSMEKGAVPHLRLSWSERGVTVASAAPRRRGFGQELIECTLPYELGAHTRLAFKPGGVTCEIDIPLEAFAPAAGFAARTAAQVGVR